ncbi:MAG: potassium channel family protein [Oscillatoria sp. PMC 1068.18]|nr:potassium channel family protein [Oscillatoria sp. PMC 1076.18]MEC4990672.1 potassium channel family protein [Oscillatoria sp. PMC 1068.18]
MQILLVVLGLFIVAIVSLDVLITTLTLGGGGPITSRLSSWLWMIALKIHNWRSNHRLLLLTGWTILVAIALLWYAFTWLGWTLFFSAENSAVINGSDKIPASWIERIYFTGFTLSTLGLGDYQPHGKIWQLATAICSANGFFLVTLTFAYLLPVVSAATSQRQLAVYISALGGTADDILVRAWNGEDFGQFAQHLFALAPMLSQQGEAHFNYPVLHYFHNLERDQSIVLSLVALDEAMTLLEYGLPKSYHPDRSALGTARRANAAYLNTLKSAYFKPSDRDPPLPDLESLRLAGMPTVTDEEFHEATKKLKKRRRMLLALLENDGWKWDAIASRKTTNRASYLDDGTTINEAVLH